MLRVAISSLLSVTILIVGVLGDGFVLDPTDTRIYDAESGCVDVTTVVPSNFSRIRLDETDFECENDTCINEVNLSEVRALMLNREPLGMAERITLHVCDLQRHAWLGFDISSMLSDGRQGFHTIFFSQANSWSVTKACIQVQKSLPINVLAMGKKSVELSCAIKSTCETHPTTIYTADRDLCRSYGPPQCRIENPDNETIVYKTTLGKPQEGRYSFAYCKTEKANVAYVIDWEGQ